MDTIRTERHVDRLRKRREEIAMTLRHLGRERAEVERNTEWISPAAYKERARLLSRVHSWYVSEIDEIDKALTRAQTSNDGLCAACDGLIDERLLNAPPESNFCYACQARQENEAEL